MHTHVSHDILSFLLFSLPSPDPFRSELRSELRSFDCYIARGGNPRANAGRSTNPLPDTASTASTSLKQRSVSTDAIRPGSSSIAAEDDTPLETAEEAAADVGVLGSASVPTGTERLLEETSCTGDNYVDCLNGNVRNTTTSCSVACGGTCCTEATSCTQATACIEKNSVTPNCDGYRACFKVGYNGGNVGAISGGSCVGNSACHYLGGFAGSVGDISNSCTTERACSGLAYGYGSTVGDISNSCTAEYACAQLAQFSGNVGNITNSCNATPTVPAVISLSTAT